MIDGNVNEFVDGLYYGDERWVLYKGVKYFIQGWVKNDNFTLVMDQMDPEPPNPTPYVPLWTMTKPYDKRGEVVEAFLTAPLWGGRTFMQAEREMKWVDC